MEKNPSAQSLVEAFTLGALDGVKVYSSSWLKEDKVLPAADGGFFVSKELFERLQSLIPVSCTPSN